MKEKSNRVAASHIPKTKRGRDARMSVRLPSQFGQQWSLVLHFGGRISGDVSCIVCRIVSEKTLVEWIGVATPLAVVTGSSPVDLVCLRKCRLYEVVTIGLIKRPIKRKEIK